MTNHFQHLTPRHARSAQRAFTLVELMVVIAIIGILAVVTLVSSRRMSAGARVSSATNAVTAVLANARAAAIRDNKPTAVVFRASWDATKPHLPQQTEVIVVRSTGDLVQFGSPSSAGPNVAERFLPLTDVQSVKLSEGIKVAGPLYEGDFSVGSGNASDYAWVTQGEMPFIMNGCQETPRFSRQFAVFFGADGAFLTRPPNASAGDHKCYVDWNRNGDAITPPADPQDVALGSCNSGNYENYWLQDHVDDETNLVFVPFLAIYDDRVARERKSVAWDGSGSYAGILSELTGPSGFISVFSDRIQFNRYSGVPEVRGR